MTNEATDEVTPEAARQACACRVCGTRFLFTETGEGLVCPACGADSVDRLAAPGGALDYVVADRTHGTTTEDVWFAQWAKWANFVTPHQYDVALHRQNSEAQDEGMGRPIHEVMESMGMLDPLRSEGLMRFLAVPRPDEFDADFVERLLKQEGVNTRAVKRVQALQKQMAAERTCVPPIGQLLLAKGVIDEVQLVDILRKQAQEDTGSLSIAMKIRGRRESPADELQKIRPVAQRVGLGLLIAIIVLGGAYMLFREKPVMVGTWCSECGYTIWQERAPSYPTECPICHSEPPSVYLGYRCPEGHVFGRLHNQDPTPCPICGSAIGEPLGPDYDYRIRREP